MKNRKLCRLFAAVLAVAMVAAMIPVSALAGFTGWFSGWKGTIAEEETMETLATGSVTQPFASGTQGSTYFRIPAIVTLDDGTIVAAADARWNSTSDGGGIDTLVAISENNGKSWDHVWAAYLGNNADTEKTDSSYGTFIDPELATDGENIWMLVDLFPRGNNNNNTGLTGNAFTNGHMRLSKGNAENTESSYTYYLGDFSTEADEKEQRAKIYTQDGTEVSGYTVDRWFNLFQNGEQISNLFYADAAYQAYPINYLYLIKSTDKGYTWSAPTLIDAKENGEIFYGTCTGSGRVLEVNGRTTIIFPCYGCLEIGTNLRASYIYSTDDGETWTRSWGRDELQFENYSSEATITEVKVGNNTYWYAFTRYLTNSWRPVYTGAYYVSDNEGQTWEAKSDIQYSCGDAMGLITYSAPIDGKPALLLSASGSSSATYRKNGRIYIYLVDEDGSLELYNTKDVNNATDYYRYSDLTELSDGSIGLLYENESGYITFKTFDISELCPNAKIGNVVEYDGDYGITVTARDLISVEAGRSLTFTIEGADEVAAYEMTLNGGAYTGAAIVEFPLPDWGDVDTSRIRGFVQEENGDITTLAADVDEAARTVTVEIPHFSNVGIYLAAEDAATYYENIYLKVGESEEVSISDNDYGGAQNRTNLDESIATVNVVGTDADKTDPVYESRSVSYSTLAGSNTSWTKTNYYYQSGIDYYPVYAYRSWNRWYTYYYGYSTTDSSNNVNTLGSNYSSSRTVTVYEKTNEGTDIPASTTITFKGNAPGDTSVIVGDTQYNIHVDKGTYTVALRPGASKTLAADYGTEIAVAPADTTIATAETTAEGILITAGNIEGSTTMATDLYIITITVADIIEVTDPALSPFVGGTTNFQNYDGVNSWNIIASKGRPLTKLTISAGLTFDVDLGNEYGTDVTWAIENTDVATVDQDGNVTALAEGETYLLATVDGATYRIPVAVRNDGTGYTTNQYGLHAYVLEETNCKVYYSAYCSAELVEAMPGEAIYLVTKDCYYKSSDSTTKGCQELCIDFFAAPEDGYALTLMQSIVTDTGEDATTGKYFSIRDENGDADTSDDAPWWNNYDATATTTNSIGSTGLRRRNAYSDDQAKAMLEAAVAKDCDGTLGFSQIVSDRTMHSVSAAVKFRADKLPAVEKKVTKVNDQPYVEGMTAGVGDKVTFEITVNRYECVNPIEYTTPTLTETDGFTFSNNQKTLSITDLLKGTGNTESEATSQTYTVTYTIQDKDLDTTITNKVDLSYVYRAKYSYGSYRKSDNAEASIVAPSLTTNDIIVDFGLPVACDYAAAAQYRNLTLTNDPASTNATVTNNVITYTPTAALLTQGYDTVSFKNTQANAATYSFKVIPASNVLYEENFLTAGNGWTKAGTALTATQSNQLAKADGIYGYDAAYASSTNVSGGYYAATGLNTSTMTAALTTTFTGTGFDLIGNCGPDTGRVMVILMNKSDTAKSRVAIIDTRYTGGTLHQVPLAHMMVEEGAYDVSIYASGLDATTANAANAVNAVGAYSVNRKSIATVDPFERYLRANNITDVEYFTVSNGLSASVQSVSAVSTYAAQAVTLKAGTHVEIDAFRVYYSTNNDNYNADEKDVHYNNILEAVDGNTVAWWTENGEYNGSVDQYEANGGPQNEIYLSNGKKAVIFNIPNVDTIQVSLRSVDGNPVSVNNGAQIASSTEMYYTLEKSGDAFTIVNTGEGILGIGNIKVPGDAGEAAILTASELEPEVVSYSLRMALAVEPDQPEEPEQPEVFLPQSFNASCRSVNVLRNKLVTVSVTASTDVAYITVNGQKVNAWNNALGWIYQPDTLRFTFTDLIKRGESKTYEIVAYNADGVASAVYTVQG